MKLFEATKEVKLGTLAQELTDKIHARKAVIGIVGLGYVGLPIALEYAKKECQPPKKDEGFFVLVGSNLVKRNILQHECRS